MKHLILSLLFMPTILLGQKKLDFDFDYAQFRFDSTSNYLEIYYSIFPSDFKLSGEDSSYSVKGKMNINIQKSVSREVVVDKNWDLTQPFKDSTDYKYANPLLGVVGFNLPEGSYNINITVEDHQETVNKRKYSESIDLIAYYRDSFSISDIEVATRILNENVNEESIFYKNTLEVYPNPSVIYSQNSPVLFYYSELYDLNKSLSDSLILEKHLYNSNNVKVYENAKILKNLKESQVEAGIVNLRKYPTDSYTFVLTLKDTSRNISTSSKKKLFLVNQNVLAQKELGNLPSDYMSSEFGILTLAECDDMFEKIKILALSNEKDNYELLDSLASKREFLYKFWQKRDNIPSTPVNEFKNIYFSRIQIANERYKTISSPGYRTDRGRIYSRLGEPDEIERHPNETNTKPYEIWFYNQIEGGVYFVFGDYTGFNFFGIRSYNIIKRTNSSIRP